jgi:hypothetical protein
MKSSKFYAILIAAAAGFAAHHTLSSRPIR